MRLNTASAIPREYTHEGAPAKRISPDQALRRSVLSCLLWEKEFYEDGKSIADRIIESAAQCNAETVSALAIEARNVHGLRHVPLLLLTDMIRRGGAGVADTVAQTIRRADEMAELVSIYWRDGKRPLSKQMKLGLAHAFGKFSEYQLAKYDRDGPVRLRDVLFLTHPKPKDAEQEALFKRVAERSLVTPDTWEVGLSGGADKRETFERLIREGKLGYLAVLRNLRNMVDAGCDMALIKDAIVARKGADLVFPFRYVAAARACPQLEPVIDQALCEAVASGPRLSGKVTGHSPRGRVRINGRATVCQVRHERAWMLLRLWRRSSTVMFASSRFRIRWSKCRPVAEWLALMRLSRSQPHGGTYLGAAC